MTGSAPENHYDDRLAALYDHSRFLGDRADSPAIEFFRRLAAKFGGPVLQVGVATGRFAVPLLRDGHEVVGIDLSTSMLERTRRRVAEECPAAADRLELATGDMRSLDLGRTFPLVMLPSNVFLYNLSQRDQLAALAAMRRHLTDDGILAVDIFTVDRGLVAAAPAPVTESQRFTSPDGDHYATNTVRVDPLNQLETLHMTHQRIGEGGELGSALFTEFTMRYVYPAEMLLLLRHARLVPRGVVGDYETSAQKRSYDGPQVFLARRGE